MKALTGMSSREFKILLITFEKILLNIALSKKKVASSRWCYDWLLEGGLRINYFS